MPPKKIPMRMCVGCRQMRSKKELIRVVRSAQGEIRVDPIGKAPGRGAYLCPSGECLDRAIKIRALERAFEHKVEADVITKLREELGRGGS
ncbi:MAG: YlxR family protein [Bacillota bacterium]